jgi:hypothetical protein
MDALAYPTRWIVVAIALLVLGWSSPAFAQEVPSETPEGVAADLRPVPPAPPVAPPSISTGAPSSGQPVSPITGAAQQVSDLTKRENLPAALQIVILDRKSVVPALHQA